MEELITHRENLPNPAVLRPSELQIDLDAIEANFFELKARAGGAKMMAVVKANAYGHGLVACARHFERIGADFLGCAFVEEGIELRQAGVRLPILVLGGIFDSQIRYFLEYELDITASSVSKLKAIEAQAAALKKRARVHLKIDTGMERIGIHYYSSAALFEEASRCKWCDFVGVFTHFATSKDEDTSFVQEQLARFQQCLKFADQYSLPIKLRHAASSGAILQAPQTHLDMVRPGLSLYGAYPGDHLRTRVTLKPALTLKSIVVFFKVVKKDAGVSYGLTWRAPEDTRVVTVPLGYGDGYMRRLSNRAHVLIRGKRYPTVGMVCMDQLMVNIGSDGTAYNGDEVVLIGAQSGERIDVHEIAELAETTPYEVFVSLNLRLPRRYYSKGQLVG